MQSWSDTQVTAQVAPGSTSGNAMILQNGVWSNPVPFSVNTLQISGISPTSGVSGTQVTITGTAFGALQGNGSVTIGGAVCQIASWSDTQIVTIVASTALTGVLRVQQNVTWSNGVPFTVPGGSASRLAPHLINMAVGDTRPIQALNASGQSMTGLAWTSSDPTIVSLSADDPPVLKALAVGHVTISAGGASADVTVSATLSPGTILWSNPGDGSGVKKIVPAVPSPTGIADVFAFQNDGTVQAITSDGTTAWSAQAPVRNSIPDFQGGLIVSNFNFSTNSYSIQKLDGLTGQPYPAYVSTIPASVVFPDGTVLIADTTSSGTVIGIDPVSGTQKFAVNVNTFDAFFLGGSPIIAGDGYAYVPHADQGPGSYPDFSITLKMLRVNSSGAYNDIPIYSFNGAEENQIPVYAITNADQGVLVSWNACETPDIPINCRRVSRMAMLAGASASMLSAPQVPDQNSPVFPVLQAQDGSYIGTTQPPLESWESDIVAFDASGKVRWSVPGHWQPQIATADGGVIATQLDSSYNPVATVMFDQDGNATGQMGSMAMYSWTSNTYQLGSVDQVWTGILINIAYSYWAFLQGNASGNGSANKPITQDVQQLIAQIALGYANQHSQNWLDTPGHNQCNIFVKDVLKQAGLNPPLSPVNPSWGWRIKYFLNQVDTPAYPAQSRDWANPSTDLKCWRPVTVNPAPIGVMGPPPPPGTLPPDISIPGDVIAEAINYSDAYGHVGIVVGPQQTASADSAAQCVFGFKGGTIDLTNYGFRPDNWVDPTGCGRIYGKKRDAVVKRFVCQ